VPLHARVCAIGRRDAISLRRASAIAARDRALARRKVGPGRNRSRDGLRRSKSSVALGPSRARRLAEPILRLTTAKKQESSRSVALISLTARLGTRVRAMRPGERSDDWIDRKNAATPR